MCATAVEDRWGKGSRVRTSHERMSQVILAVLILFNIFPFEVGATAAVCLVVNFLRFLKGIGEEEVGTGCLLSGRLLRDPSCFCELDMVVRL